VSRSPIRAVDTPSLAADHVLRGQRLSSALRVPTSAELQQVSTRRAQPTTGSAGHGWPESTSTASATWPTTLDNSADPDYRGVIGTARMVTTSTANPAPRAIRIGCVHARLRSRRALNAGSAAERSIAAFGGSGADAPHGGHPRGAHPGQARRTDPHRRRGPGPEQGPYLPSGSPAFGLVGDSDANIRAVIPADDLSCGTVIGQTRPLRPILWAASAIRSLPYGELFQSAS
jgi:hypothetical protein